MSNCRGCAPVEGHLTQWPRRGQRKLESAPTLQHTHTNTHERIHGDHSTNCAWRRKKKCRWAPWLLTTKTKWRIILVLVTPKKPELLSRPRQLGNWTRTPEPAAAKWLRDRWRPILHFFFVGLFSRLPMGHRPRCYTFIQAVFTYLEIPLVDIPLPTRPRMTCTLRKFLQSNDPPVHNMPTCKSRVDRWPSCRPVITRVSLEWNWK